MMNNIRQMLDNKQHALETNTCVSCKTSITGFRDKLSLDEYRLSALCQECQDKVFLVCEICGKQMSNTNDLDTDCGGNCWECQEKFES